MKHKKSVVIVGGGLAGLSAAYYLSRDERYRVTVLEGAERLGGRVYTTEIDSIPIDLGGFMVFPWYKYFKSLLDDLDLSKDLREYTNYTEYYQAPTGDSYLKDTEVPIWKVFPWKMMQRLIIPFFTNRLDFYEPDLELMQRLTAKEVFEEPEGTESKAEFFANELATAYTYADLREIPVSLYLGFGYKLLEHHGFDRCRSITGGTQRVIDAMARAIRDNGGEIRIGCRVTDVHEGTIRTLKTSLHADKIILAHGIHDPLVGSLLGKSTTKSAWYTNHYAVALRLRKPVTVGKDTEWMVTYNRPQTGTKPYVVSVGNLSAVNIDERTLILYVRIHPDDSTVYSKKDIQALVARQLKKQFRDVSIEKFLAIHHWRQTMPVVETELVAAVRNNQGKGGVYFAGDYLGSPCMETAVYTGKRAADMILS